MAISEDGARVVLPGLLGVSMLTDAEREACLSYMPQEKGRVLEIGSWTGTTLCWWASRRPRCQFVVAEPFTGSSEPETTKGLWQSNVLKTFGEGSRRVRLYRNVDDVLDHFPGKCDFIFIDGDHHEDAVLNDLSQAFVLGNDHCVYAVHDYASPRTQTLGVMRAVDRFDNSFKKKDNKLSAKMRQIGIVDWTLFFKVE